MSCAASNLARQAERLAKETRAQSERLLGYLSDDFGRDLESFGELKTVAEFAQRQIDYLAKQVTLALGALTLANVFAATDHADADGYSSAALTALGRLDEGTSAAQSGAELARRVLVQRPGNRQALHAQQISLSYLMAIPISRLDPETAVQLGPQVLEASRVQLGLDPDNTFAISNQGVAYENLAIADWRAGQLREGALVWTGEFLAQLGDLPGLQALAADDARFLALHPLSSAAADDLHYRQSMAPYLQGLTAEARGDQATARRLATEAAAQVPWAERKVLAQTSIGSPGVLDGLAARTALRMGDFAAAVKALDMTLANWNLTENDAPDQPVRTRTCRDSQQAYCRTAHPVRWRRRGRRGYGHASRTNVWACRLWCSCDSPFSAGPSRRF